MRLLIDGNEVGLDLSPTGTLGAVVAEAGRLAAARGRVAHRIAVDGREITTREEREMAARPAAEIGEIRVQTTAPATLLREAIDGALDLSTAIRRDVKEVSSSIRSGDVPSAKSLYVSCVESLGTFFQLAGAVFNGVRSGAFPLPGAAGGSTGDLPGPPGSTADILQRLLALQRAEDWGPMADLLDREVAPNLEEWSAFFSAMRGRG